MYMHAHVSYIVCIRVDRLIGEWMDIGKWMKRFPCQFHSLTSSLPSSLTHTLFLCRFPIFPICRYTMNTSIVTTETSTCCDILHVYPCPWLQTNIHKQEARHAGVVVGVINDKFFHCVFFLVKLTHITTSPAAAVLTSIGFFYLTSTSFWPALLIAPAVRNM